MARGVHLFDPLILIAASVRHQDDGPSTLPRMSPAWLTRVASLEEWARTGKSVAGQGIPTICPSWDAADGCSGAVAIDGASAAPGHRLAIWIRPKPNVGSRPG
jgi:hypothetical protein